MALHGSIEYPAYSTRAVPSDYEHNGSKFVLVAPWRKNLTFTFGARLGSGNLHDIRPCAYILKGQPPPDELEVLSARVRGVGKDRNSRRYTALHEIRGLQRARGAGISRYNNDISDPNRFVDRRAPILRLAEMATKRREQQ
jgi:hypothetical protein